MPAAMEAEAAPLLEALQLSRDDPPRIPPPAPCISFSGRIQDLDVHIVCNGERQYRGNMIAPEPM